MLTMEIRLSGGGQDVNPDMLADSRAHTPGCCDLELFQ